MFEALKPFIDFFRFSYQHKHVFCEKTRKKTASMKRMCYKKLYGAVKVARERCELCVHKNNTTLLRFAVWIAKKGLCEIQTWKRIIHTLVLRWQSFCVTQKSFSVSRTLINSAKLQFNTTPNIVGGFCWNNHIQSCNFNMNFIKQVFINGINFVWYWFNWINE